MRKLLIDESVICEEDWSDIKKYLKYSMLREGDLRRYKRLDELGQINIMEELRVEDLSYEELLKEWLGVKKLREEELRLLERLEAEGWEVVICGDVGYVHGEELKLLGYDTYFSYELCMRKRSRIYYMCYVQEYGGGWKYVSNDVESLNMSKRYGLEGIYYDGSEESGGCEWLYGELKRLK